MLELEEGVKVIDGVVSWEGEREPRLQSALESGTYCPIEPVHASVDGSQCPGIQIWKPKIRKYTPDLPGSSDK